MQPLHIVNHKYFTSVLWPQVVLGTKKHEVPGLFKALAVNFRRRDLAFGWYSADLDPSVANQFGNQKLPAVVAAFIDPTTQPDASGQVPLGMLPFQMPLKYTYLENWLETIVERHGRGSDQVRCKLC
jgi:hypothetical protein